MNTIEFSKIKVGQVFWYHYEDETPIKCIKSIKTTCANGYYLDGTCLGAPCYFIDCDICTLTEMGV